MPTTQALDACSIFNSSVHHLLSSSFDANCLLPTTRTCHNTAYENSDNGLAADQKKHHFMLFSSSLQLVVLVNTTVKTVAKTISKPPRSYQTLPCIAMHSMHQNHSDVKSSNRMQSQYYGAFTRNEYLVRHGRVQRCKGCFTTFCCSA